MPRYGLSTLHFLDGSGRIINNDVNFLWCALCIVFSPLLILLVPYFQFVACHSLVHNIKMPRFRYVSGTSAASKVRRVLERIMKTASSCEEKYAEAYATLVLVLGGVPIKRPLSSVESGQTRHMARDAYVDKIRDAVKLIEDSGCKLPPVTFDADKDVLAGMQLEWFADFICRQVKAGNIDLVEAPRAQQRALKILTNGVEEVQSLQLLLTTVSAAATSIVSLPAHCRNKPHLLQALRNNGFHPVVAKSTKAVGHALMSTLTSIPGGSRGKKMNRAVMLTLVELMSESSIRAINSFSISIIQASRVLVKIIHKITMSSHLVHLREVLQRYMWLTMPSAATSLGINLPAAVPKSIVKSLFACCSKCTAEELAGILRTVPTAIIPKLAISAKLLDYRRIDIETFTPVALTRMQQHLLRTIVFREKVLGDTLIEILSSCTNATAATFVIDSLLGENARQLAQKAAIKQSPFKSWPYTTKMLPHIVQTLSRLHTYMPLGIQSRCLKQIVTTIKFAGPIFSDTVAQRMLEDVIFAVSSLVTNRVDDSVLIQPALTQAMRQVANVVSGSESKWASIHVFREVLATDLVMRINSAYEGERPWNSRIESERTAAVKIWNQMLLKVGKTAIAYAVETIYGTMHRKLANDLAGVVKAVHVAEAPNILSEICHNMLPPVPTLMLLASSKSSVQIAGSSSDLRANRYIIRRLVIETLLEATDNSKATSGDSLASVIISHGPSDSDETIGDEHWQELQTLLEGFSTLRAVSESLEQPQIVFATNHPLPLRQRADITLWKTHGFAEEFERIRPSLSMQNSTLYKLATRHSVVWLMSSDVIKQQEEDDLKAVLASDLSSDSAWKVMCNIVDSRLAAVPNVAEALRTVIINDNVKKLVHSLISDTSNILPPAILYLIIKNKGLCSLKCKAIAGQVISRILLDSSSTMLVGQSLWQLLDFAVDLHDADMLARAIETIFAQQELELHLVNYISSHLSQDTLVSHTAPQRVAMPYGYKGITSVAMLEVLSQALTFKSRGKLSTNTLPLSSPLRACLVAWFTRGTCAIPLDQFIQDRNLWNGLISLLPDISVAIFEDIIKDTCVEGILNKCPVTELETRINSIGKYTPTFQHALHLLRVGSQSEGLVSTCKFLEANTCQLLQATGNDAALMNHVIMGIKMKVGTAKAIIEAVKDNETVLVAACQELAGMSKHHRDVVTCGIQALTSVAASPATVAATRDLVRAYFSTSIDNNIVSDDVANVCEISCTAVMNSMSSAIDHADLVGEIVEIFMHRSDDDGIATKRCKSRIVESLERLLTYIPSKLNLANSTEQEYAKSLSFTVWVGTKLLTAGCTEAALSSLLSKSDELLMVNVQRKYKIAQSELDMVGSHVNRLVEYAATYLSSTAPAKGIASAKSIVESAFSALQYHVLHVIADDAQRQSKLVDVMLRFPRVTMGQALPRVVQLFPELLERVLRMIKRGLFDVPCGDRIVPSTLHERAVQGIINRYNSCMDNIELKSKIEQWMLRVVDESTVQPTVIEKLKLVSMHTPVAISLMQRHGQISVTWAMQRDMHMDDVKAICAFYKSIAIAQTEENLELKGDIVTCISDWVKAMSLSSAHHQEVEYALSVLEEIGGQ